MGGDGFEHLQHLVETTGILLAGAVKITALKGAGDKRLLNAIMPCDQDC